LYEWHSEGSIRTRVRQKMFEPLWNCWRRLSRQQSGDAMRIEL
jgi:hypothetical protein